ncbi:MAG: ROK family transcriptional regulator [Phycisphaerae bacterium]
MDWQVLQVVHRLGPLPQHKLADHLGRQRSTVNGATQRLMASGWLQKVGQSGQGRGRPAILLAVNRAIGCFAGIDIAADELHWRWLRLTVIRWVATVVLGEDRTLDMVLEQIDLALRGLLSQIDLGLKNILGLWAGINGAVDRLGNVVTCASLGWHNEPLGKLLTEKYETNVLVQGAATAMNAAAESLMGAGRDASSLAYYRAGQGISARFVQQGRPLAGATQRAGELGHVVVEPGGRKCPCGNRGCLESVASGPGIVAGVKELDRNDIPKRVLKAIDEKLPTQEIVHACFDHYKENDTKPFSTLLYRKMNFIALGAAMVVAAYDPEVLVLGGYLFENNHALRDGVHRRLREMVLDWDLRNLKVVEGEVITQDRAVGGAAEVCQRFWANPRGVVAHD